MHTFPAEVQQGDALPSVSAVVQVTRGWRREGRFVLEAPHLRLVGWGLNPSSGTSWWDGPRRLSEPRFLFCKIKKIESTRLSYCQHFKR